MGEHRFTLPRLAGVVAGCSLLVLLCAAAALALGEQPISLARVFEEGSTDAVIFFSLRLPRVLLAALVGLALAASGSMLQGLLRNPLADPFVLGVSGGSALGATVALAFGLPAMLSVPATTVLALGGALGATVLVLAVGRLAGGDRAHTTLLAGVIFNAFALAAITFIKALVAPDQLGAILFWLAGRLGVERWSALGLCAALVVGSVVTLCALAPRLNLLVLGDDDARSLGLDVPTTRWVLLGVGSLAVAAAVSLSGLIGFVGLLVPHLARLLFGPDARLHVPASALLGAAFLMLADLCARLLFRVFNTEPPVGGITALIGGPLFLLLLVRKPA